MVASIEDCGCVNGVQMGFNLLLFGFAWNIKMHPADAQLESQLDEESETDDNRESVIRSMSMRSVSSLAENDNLVRSMSVA